MPKLRVLDEGGDSVLEWTRERDEEEVEREFNRLVREGHLASRVDAPGKSTHIREFDPGAEEILFNKALIGG